MTTLSDIADAAIERDWATNPRWAGVERPYEAADVIRLRGSVRVEHSLARRGAEQLWEPAPPRGVRQRAWRDDGRRRRSRWSRRG